VAFAQIIEKEDHIAGLQQAVVLEDGVRVVARA